VRIEDGNKKVEDLTREIEALSSQLTLTAKESQTLANRLKQLELTKKKLAADIALTTRRIDNAGATIEELTQNIAKTQASIDSSMRIITETVKMVAEKESESLLENLIKYKSISNAWDYVSALSDVEEQMRLRLLDLKDERADLSVKKDALENQKKELEGYKQNLSDQKKVADYNSTETNRLLSTTKNKQAEYEKQLAIKKAQKEAFEAELFSYESALQIAIDPNSIPSERSGVLKWPLDNIFVTQYFGKTSASKRLYVSGTHNGIDFRAITGTAVRASLSGTVQATGNTDYASSRTGSIQHQNTSARNCQSYGKWVLIRHANGLSTLYAHLSVVSVNTGDTVITGDRIGYSGNTGYSTGPHLHLTVFASQGVRVEKFSNSKNCQNVTLPLADTKAYLDPSAYLPR
jgi:murein DD-endopeptidase MepM/ murein hydrolase activator NlpD